jgi:hypothetical protein
LKPGVLMPMSVISAFGATRQLEDRWVISCRPQENPWFLFELDSRHHVDFVEISFGARPGRPPPVKVTYSVDSINWTAGRFVDRGREWHLVIGGPARLVSVFFEGFTDVHVPVKFFGRVILERTAFGFFDHETRIYAVAKDAGFFSNMLTALQDIFELAARGIRVDDIDARRSYGHYRDFPGQDVYSLLHSKNVLGPQTIAFGNDRQAIRPPDKSWNEIVLSDLPFAAVSNLIDRYYRFRPEIEKRSVSMIESLGMDLSRTICVYYRGTDKAKEFALAPVSRYLETCDRLLESSPNSRILAQSDDARALQEICRHYGERAFIIPGVPVSMDGSPVHVRTKEGRVDGLIKFLVAFQVMKACRQIVCTMSNVSIALALYRGSANNMVVIRETGEVSDYTARSS